MNIQACFARNYIASHNRISPLLAELQGTVIRMLKLMQTEVDAGQNSEVCKCMVSKLVYGQQFPRIIGQVEEASAHAGSVQSKCNLVRKERIARGLLLGYD